MLRSKHKLQWDVFRVTVWSTARMHDMCSHFLQCCRGDSPGVKQRRNNLVFKHPADLEDRQQIILTVCVCVQPSALKDTGVWALGQKLMITFQTVHRSNKLRHKMWIWVNTLCNCLQHNDVITTSWAQPLDVGFHTYLFALFFSYGNNILYAFRFCVSSVN